MLGFEKRSHKQSFTRVSHIADSVLTGRKKLYPINISDEESQTAIRNIRVSHIQAHAHSMMYSTHSISQLENIKWNCFYFAVFMKLHRNNLA